MQIITQFISLLLKFFFILTPFFVLSMFLSMTEGWPVQKKIKLAARVITATFVSCLVMLILGRWLFSVFGITIDAFRIGGGALLFLSAVRLVNDDPRKNEKINEQSDIAVVPLAIPVAVGPATTAVLFVAGAENRTVIDWVLTMFSMSAAIVCLGVLLYLAARLEQFLGHRALSILSKLSGLILAALAAQMIFTGIQAFLC